MSPMRPTLIEQSWYFLVVAETFDHEGQECAQVFLEVAFKGCNDGANSEEGVFQHSGCLAPFWMSVKRFGHDAVTQWQRLAAKTANNKP